MTVVCGFGVMTAILEFNRNFYYLIRGWFGLDEMAILFEILCFLILAIRIAASCNEVKFRVSLFDDNGDNIVRLIVSICLVRVFFFG